MIGGANQNLEQLFANSHLLASYEWSRMCEQASLTHCRFCCSACGKLAPSDESWRTPGNGRFWTASEKCMGWSATRNSHPVGTCLGISIVCVTEARRRVRSAH